MSLELYSTCISVLQILDFFFATTEIYENFEPYSKEPSDWYISYTKHKEDNHKHRS